MLRETRILNSRNAWKDKARIRADQIREDRKLKTRLYNKVSEKDARIAELEEKISELEKKN